MATTTGQTGAATRWAGFLRRLGLIRPGRFRHAPEIQESEPEMNDVTVNVADTSATHSRTEDSMTAFTATDDSANEAETSGTEAAASGTEAQEAELQALLDLRKKELVDRVVARTGAKKKDVKPVVEAVLQELGDAVGEGRALNLEPFGKLNINRTDTRANGRVTVCRLRQSIAQPVPADEPLAEPAE